MEDIMDMGDMDMVAMVMATEEAMVMLATVTMTITIMDTIMTIITTITTTRDLCQQQMISPTNQNLKATAEDQQTHSLAC